MSKAELSDEELMLLSNFSYMPLGFDGFDIKEQDLVNGRYSIAEVLDHVDIGALETTNADMEYPSMIKGKEWAKIVNAIKSDDKLKNLIIQNYETDSREGKMFTAFDESINKNYVVFKGTGECEWPDNFNGGTEPDTAQQIAALEYINEKVVGSDITVVGHSKGGNKAKYVSILSDKVTRCVSLDGQGFSNEFLAKYADMIKKKSSIITNYALSRDYVNILLNDIGKKWYIEPYNVDSFPEYHCPNAFLDFSNGTMPSIHKTEQDNALKVLHEFTVYISNIQDEEDRKRMLDLLGKIADYTMGSEQDNKLGLLTFLTPENAEDMGMLASYIKKYNEYTHGQFFRSVDSLVDNAVEFSGPIASFIFRYIKITTTISIPFNYITKSLDYLIDKYINSIFWDMDTEIFKHILKMKFKEFYKAAQSAMESRDKSIKNIPGQDKTRSLKSLTMIHDYSNHTRDTILQTIQNISNDKFYNVSSWAMRYYGATWYTKINVDSYIRQINSYYKDVDDIVNKCLKAVRTNFAGIDDASDKVTESLIEQQKNIEWNINQMKYLSK